MQGELQTSDEVGDEVTRSPGLGVGTRRPGSASLQAVSAGIVAIYIAATLIGGLAAGKMAKSRRFLWGLMTGVLYFVLLILITLGVYRTLDGSGIHMATTFVLCAGGGMIGGMIS